MLCKKVGQVREGLHATLEECPETPGHCQNECPVRAIETAALDVVAKGLRES
jgi:hypothetical protein